MTGWPEQPVIYEVNTAVWLNALSRAARRRLADLLRDAVFERDGGELTGPGLFVDLAPWQFHLLALHAR